jgi:hypothetical protein
MKPTTRAIARRERRQRQPKQDNNEQKQFAERIELLARFRARMHKGKEPS